MNERPGENDVPNESVPEDVPVADAAGETRSLEDLDEPDSFAQPTLPRRRYDYGKRTTVLLAIAAVAGLVGTLLFAELWRRESNRPADEVLHVAQRFGENLANITHKSVDADINKIKLDTTAKFQKEFLKLVGKESSFRKSIIEGQAVNSGEVQWAAVDELGSDSAVVVMGLEQRFSNRIRPEPQTITQLLQLTMAKIGGRWKVDGVQNVRANRPAAATPRPG